MQTGRNKLLYILITIFVFVSGMYLDDIKENSVPPYEHTELTNFYISAEDSVINDSQACTTDMLGIRGNTGTGNLVRLANQKRDNKISLDFLLENIFSLNEGKSYASFEEDQLIVDNREELVTNYIHNSDGKKRS